jgi:hypothetical protein
MCKNIRFLDNNFFTTAANVTSDADLNGVLASEVFDSYNFGKYRLTENGVLGGYVIDVELAGELSPSSFALIPDDIRVFYLTSETEVVLQASNTSFDVIEKEYTLNWSRFGIFGDLTEQGVDNSYRYWRIWVKEFNRGESEKNESLDIKYLYLGDHVLIDDRNISTSIGVQLEDRSKIQMAESGRVYANLKRPQLKITNLRFQFQNGSDRVNFQQFYHRTGKSENFLCVVDPNGITEAEKFELMRVMRFEKNPTQSHVVRDLFEQTFTLVEAL